MIVGDIVKYSEYGGIAGEEPNGGDGKDDVNG